MFQPRKKKKKKQELNEMMIYEVAYANWGNQEDRELICGIVINFIIRWIKDWFIFLKT